MVKDYDFNHDSVFSTKGSFGHFSSQNASQAQPHIVTAKKNRVLEPGQARGHSTPWARAQGNARRALGEVLKTAKNLKPPSGTLKSSHNLSTSLDISNNL